MFSDDNEDIENSAGIDIRCWTDADVCWVTDMIAQRIKAAAAAAAASDDDFEFASTSADVPVHAPLSQTVETAAFVFKCVNRYYVVFVLTS